MTRPARRERRALPPGVAVDTMPLSVRFAIFESFALVLVVLAAVGALRVHGREARLRREGTITDAHVVGQGRRDGVDVLTVSFVSPCGCRADVAIEHASRHPIGSAIPVRYVLGHPGRIVALVDRPDPYEGPMALGVSAGAMSVVFALLVASREWRSRRRRRLADRLPLAGRVRVEAWRTGFARNVRYYLSLYPVDSTSDAPGACIQVEGADLRNVFAQQTFELHTRGTRSPVALRDGDTVVVSIGKAKPGTWERRRRVPLSTLDIDIEPGVPAVPRALPIDRADALTMQRITRSATIAAPSAIASVVIAALLPSIWAAIALAIFFVGFAVLFALARRRRRLVQRVAARLGEGSRPTRRERVAAINALSFRLVSPACDAQRAVLLGITPEQVRTDRKRARIAVCSVLVIAVVPFAVAALWS